MKTTSLIPEPIRISIELLQKEANELFSLGQDNIALGNKQVKESQIKHKLAEDLIKAYSFVASPIEGLNLDDDEPFSLQRLKSHLAAGNGGRIGHLAKYFGVPELDVAKAINQPNSGVHVGPRGWVKLGQSPLL